MYSPYLDYVGIPYKIITCNNIQFPMLYNMQDQYPGSFQGPHNPVAPNPSSYWGDGLKGVGGAFVNGLTSGLTNLYSNSDAASDRFDRDLNDWQRDENMVRSLDKFGQIRAPETRDRAQSPLKSHRPVRINWMTGGPIPENYQFPKGIQTNEVYDNDPIDRSVPSIHDLRGNDDNTLEPRDPGNPPKTKGKNPGKKTQPKKEEGCLHQ